MHFFNTAAMNNQRFGGGAYLNFIDLQHDRCVDAFSSYKYRRVTIRGGNSKRFYHHTGIISYHSELYFSGYTSFFKRLIEHC